MPEFLYEGWHWVGKSIARPLIAKECMKICREVGAEAFAHVATGKGNDQCRFQFAAETLNPAEKIRDFEFSRIRMLPRSG